MEVPSYRANSQATKCSSVGHLIQSYSAHGYEVLSLSVAPDNGSFASAGGDRIVFLWDVATAVTTRRFGGNKGHTARINTVTFAGEAASLLISGSFDASVRIWDVKSRSMVPIMVLTEACDSISSVLASDEIIWTGSVDGRIRQYDVRMGRILSDVIGAPVTCLSKTADNKAILVGGLDSQIRLMDNSTGGLLKKYRAAVWKNEEFRLRSCFGAREKWVLCGNEQVTGTTGEVAVWDTLSGDLVDRIQVSGGAVAAEGKKKIGHDGQEKTKKNVISCVTWKNSGRGKEWCCGGTDGIVTVFGEEGTQ